MNITLSINGRTVNAERGQTVLEAARANGIYIPTLCDFPGLSPHGSCRMCIVEVMGRANTPAACTTLVEEGMQVETDTPNIHDLRQEILRMLLADHPACCLFCSENGHCEDCMVTLRKTGVTTGCRTCPADGQCELQEIASHSGLHGVNYPVRYRELPIEKRDPFFDRDYNLCVLCGRCIHVCESLHFTSIPAYVQRGSETRVGTSFGQTHLAAGCSFCGACVDACPTGALSEKTRKWDGKPAAETETACPFCSLGCEMRLLTSAKKADMIIGSMPADPGKYLCVKGRFGVTETLNHSRRLTEALYVEQGKAVRSSVDEAIAKAADQLTSCCVNDFALVISASCSNEELYVADKFSREVMGVPAILDAGARYGSRLGVLSRLMQISQPLDVLDTADLIFCLGLDVKYTQSVVEAYLKHALERGAQVISLNAAEHVPGRFASLWLKPEAGKEESVLEDIIRGTATGEAGDIMRLLRTAKKAVLLAGSETLVRMPEAVEQLYKASNALLAAIPAEGNLSGALRLGLGAADCSSSPKSLYLIGVSVPVDLNPDAFVICQNTHLPSENPENGVLLPMAAFGEVDSSLIDQGGRMKQLYAAVAPAGDALPGWKILCRIAQSMGKTGFGFASVDDIRAEMQKSSVEWTESADPPAWLKAPDAHDFMGADLREWVAGLRTILAARQKEGEHVHTA